MEISLKNLYVEVGDRRVNSLKHVNTLALGL